MKRLLEDLRRDERGSTIIEFALLAPIIFSMMFGVMQVGISMHAYNAMRSVSAETARYAVVEYEKKNEVSNSAIQDEAERIATSAPYMMDENFQAYVTDGVSPIAGAKKMNLIIHYTPPDIMPFLNFTSRQLEFERPIFVIDE